MQERIGDVAGEVWRFLEKNGESSLSAIGDSVDAPRSKVHMAIGWLAKENKLTFKENGRGTLYSLR